MSKIYAGVSAFFANRPGNHNWLDNHARPFISFVHTKASGKKRYEDLFLNADKSIKVMVTDSEQKIAVPAGYVVTMFPADTKQPLYRVLHKGV